MKLNPGGYCRSSADSFDCDGPFRGFPIEETRRAIPVRPGTTVRLLFRARVEEADAYLGRKRRCGAAHRLRPRRGTGGRRWIFTVRSGAGRAEPGCRLFSIDANYAGRYDEWIGFFGLSTERRVRSAQD